MSQHIQTITVAAQHVPALQVAAEPGFVTINGVPMLPHEAKQFAGALSKAAWMAGQLAEQACAAGS